MRAIPLAESQVKIVAEPWGVCKRQRWKVSGSIIGLSCVNYVLWIRDESWDKAPAVAKAAMMLQLQRKLQMHLDAVEPFVALESADVEAQITK